MHLILIRHGRVAQPWEGLIYGDLDVPLSTAGEEQSRRVARQLRGAALDAVVSSGLARAEFCAELVRASRALPRRDEPRLREIHRGRWAGWSRERVEADSPGAWSRFWAAGGSEPPPGGESLTDVSARVVRALDELADEFPDGRVVAVAHKWVLRVAVCHALGLPLERCARVAVPLAGAACLDWPARAVRAGGALPELTRLGDAPHLD